MKRFSRISGLVAIVIFIQSVCLSGLPTAAEGVSTDVPFDPFTGYTPIYTAADLNAIRSNLDGHYYLANDIVFQASDFEEGGDYYNDGEGWLPIGYTVDTNASNAEDRPFTGILDGRNHSIIGLVMTPKGFDICTAMFAYNFGKITRISLEASLYNATSLASTGETQKYGLLCVRNNGIIESCTVSGSIGIQLSAEISYGNQYTTYAGLAVYNQGSISRCSNRADIRISTPPIDSSNLYPSTAAGVCGTNTGTIVNCSNSGDIIRTSASANNTSYHISGIAANNYGSIQYCYNTGDIQNGGYESAIIAYNSRGSDTQLQRLRFS
jgi:hypothetical protein